MTAHVTRLLDIEGLDVTGRDGAASDDYLVARARDGYLDAFEILAVRHRDRIYRTALRLTGQPADAEDVTQDVLVSAWQGLKGFRGESAVTSWLYRITVNHSHRHIARRRSTVSLDHAPEHAVAGADDRAIDRARTAAIGQAIAALPMDQREVLVLHQFEGLPYEQIADILGVAEPTVRGRLARARRGLVNTLTAKEWS